MYIILMCENYIAIDFRRQVTYHTFKKALKNLLSTNVLYLPKPTTIHRAQILANSSFMLDIKLFFNY